MTRFRDWLTNGEWPQFDKIAYLTALTLAAIDIAAVIWVAVDHLIFTIL